MSDDHIYWGKFTRDDILETDTGYHAELPAHCKCGLLNSWIKLDEFMSFWGCRVCWHKERRAGIKLVSKQEVGDG
ncbi:hypothetical protein LCGC14_1793540 [marine sediment metagenome]|uniref:Uncharacterized protein n=1 Tax=marine sediment metagenome TaxID=412755 RepID=A0A0F9J6L2_9ZZZZ